VAALDRIRTEGFRRWYERQLIECHAWLVTWFLGLIVLVSGVELTGAGRSSLFIGAVLIVSGLMVALLSWKRYRLMLEVAERLGEQAACPACLVYARFSIESSGPNPLPDGGDEALQDKGGGIWLRAHCRSCGEKWVMR